MIWLLQGNAGARLGDVARELDLLPKVLTTQINRSLSTDEHERGPTDDLRSARIAETVLSHETHDWPSFYDQLSALVCRVVAQSTLSAYAKTLLTRRLIEHITELEKWWPRLRPK